MFLNFLNYVASVIYKSTEHFFNVVRYYKREENMKNLLLEYTICGHNFMLNIFLKHYKPFVFAKIIIAKVRLEARWKYKSSRITAWLTPLRPNSLFPVNLYDWVLFSDIIIMKGISKNLLHSFIHFFPLDFTFCAVNIVICNEYYKYREQKLFKDSKKIYDNINSDSSPSVCN